jgi:hypothetical protein
MVPDQPGPGHCCRRSRPFSSTSALPQDRSGHLDPVVCSLQVFRWQPAWVIQAFPNHPNIQQKLVMVPQFTLNVLDQKVLNHRLADWHLAQPPTSAAFITASPTDKILDSPTSGYIQSSNRVAAIELFSENPGRLDYFLQLGRNEYDELYLIYSNWNSTQNQKYTTELLDRYKSFRIETVFKDESRNELWIYRFTDPVSMSNSTTSSKDLQVFASRLYGILLGRMIDLFGLESWDYIMSNAVDRRTCARDALMKGLVNSLDILQDKSNPGDAC